LSTNNELLELLEYLKNIEKEIGRRSSKKWGPREIDLDILFFNDNIYSNERVTVPHKDILKRDFVLVPLCEIAPDFVHPALNMKICDICINNSEKYVIKRLPDKII